MQETPKRFRQQVEIVLLGVVLSGLLLACGGGAPPDPEPAVDPAAIAPTQESRFLAARKQQEAVLVATEETVKGVSEASDDEILQAMQSINRSIITARQAVQFLHGEETPERRQRIRALREGNARLRLAYTALEEKASEPTLKILKKGTQPGS